MRRALAAGAAGAVPAIADLHDLEVLPQIGGVGAARTKLAVRAIGTLHGRFWQAEGRPPLSACRTAPTPEFSRYLQIAYWVCLVSVFDSFGDLFSAQMRRVAEAFGLRMADHFAATAAGPRTFIHGDYRGENILFGTGGSDEVAVVDWQASGIGSGLYDLAYFLGTSLLIGDRRRVEREALEEYYASVSRMGAEDFSFEDCWRSYRQNMLGVLLPSILANGALALTDPSRQELARAMLGRTQAAIEDLDAAEFLPAGGGFPTLNAALSMLSFGGYRLYGAVRRARRTADG